MSNGKAFDKFVSVMDSFSDKISKLDGLMAIKDSFVDVMPLIIVGSFGTLFANVICSPTAGLAKWIPALQKFQSLFNVINYATMNILSLFMVYLIAATYAKYKDVDSRVSGLVALASFVILIPQAMVATNANGIKIPVPNVLQSKYTDAKGLFLAIIVGLLTTIVLSKLSKAKALKVRMPASVPPNVSKSFEILFPSLITCFLFSVIGYVFNMALGLSVSDAIFNFLQVPMLKVMQFPAGVIILVLFAQCFWAVGIHGSNLAEVVRSSIGLAAIAANLQQYQAGEHMTNIFTYTFWNTYATIGGSGCTIGLIIAIFLVARKRQDIKAIGKISFAPMFFGINEPLIFGLPIVLNPLIIIPFILAPVVSSAIGYISTAIGFASPAMVTVPWTTPFLLNAYLSTGGSIPTVITQLICIVVVTLIYIPFVKLLDMKEEEEVA